LIGKTAGLTQQYLHIAGAYQMQGIRKAFRRNQFGNKIKTEIMNDIRMIRGGIVWLK